MLAGKNNEEKIWNYLKGAGLNDFGTAGLMGNLYAESGLIPNNVENLYEKRLGVTDASYTAAVDSGKYQFFATDKAGYGPRPMDILLPQGRAAGLCPMLPKEHRRSGNAA